MTTSCGPATRSRRSFSLKKSLGTVRSRTASCYYGALKDGRLAGPNAEEIISVLNEYTAIKDPQIFRTIVPNGVDPDGKVDVSTLKDDLDVYKMQGWIQGEASVEDVIDMSFVEKAIKELGPYKRG